MPDWPSHIIYPLARWMHIVATTLLVGGTLFYELVVPIAIEDLKTEQQLTVFGRARWSFRWVVWISAVLLVISGLVGLARLWLAYSREFLPAQPWAVAHILLGWTAIVIALLLTLGRRPPAHPITWMRVNLVLLLTVIMLASIARHVRLTILGPGRGGPIPSRTVNEHE